MHFTPGARTAWHTHPNGQTIYVTEGIGLRSAAAARSRSSAPATASSSSRRGPLARRRPDRFMTHLAMVEVDDEGNAATWGEHVTDEEYNAAPVS